MRDRVSFFENKCLFAQREKKGDAPRRIPRLLLCLFLLLLIGLLAACGGEKDPKDWSDLSEGEIPSAGRLLRGLCKGGDCSMPSLLFFQGEKRYEERFEGLYHCSPEGLRDGAIALSEGNTADEVAIFLPEDEGRKETLLSTLRDHIQEEISVYEGYSPTDVAHLKDARLYSEGNLVILIVSGDGERIQAALSDYLKNPDKLPQEDASSPANPADPGENPSEGGASSGAVPSPDPGDLPDLPSGKDSDGASSGETPAPPTPPTPTGVYAYENDLPENGKQPVEYLSDALFIGDSRMEDLLHYLKPKNAGAYAYSALSVSAVFTKNLVQKPDGGRCTIAEDLREKRPHFTKCYLSFGLNEIGWPYLTKFSAEYEKVISLVRELNPDCTIYLMNIYPVTASHSAEQISAGKEENNENIRRFNDCIAELAGKAGVYHLNLAAAVCDEAGVLPEDAAGDGVHGDIHLCRKILDYLLTHTAG